MPLISYLKSLFSAAYRELTAYKKTIKFSFVKIIAYSIFADMIQASLKKKKKIFLHA